MACCGMLTSAQHHKRLRTIIFIGMLLLPPYRAAARHAPALALMRAVAPRHGGVEEKWRSWRP